MPEWFYDRELDALRDFSHDYWRYCERDELLSVEFLAALEALEARRFRPPFPPSSRQLRTWGCHPLCAGYCRRWELDPERGADESASERALWALGRHVAACEACQRGCCGLGDRLEEVVRYPFERTGKGWPPQ